MSETDYTQLLIGNGRKQRKAVSADVAAKRLEALKKGRETAAKNRAMKGKGLVGSAGTQDMLDTPQVVYAGNPVDVLGPVSQIANIRGSGKHGKKLSKKDLECIALAEEQNKVEAEATKCEGSGKAKAKATAVTKKPTKKHVESMTAEAIRRLGTMAQQFKISYVEGIPDIQR